MLVRLWLQNIQNFPYSLSRQLTYQPNMRDKRQNIKSILPKFYSLWNFDSIDFWCCSIFMFQLHSEYRSTYRWHEYTGPRQQEVVRRPPMTAATGKQRILPKKGARALMSPHATWLSARFPPPQFLGKIWGAWCELNFTRCCPRGKWWLWRGVRAESESSEKFLKKELLRLRGGEKSGRN